MVPKTRKQFRQLQLQKNIRNKTRTKCSKTKIQRYTIDNRAQDTICPSTAVHIQIQVHIIKNDCGEIDLQESCDSLLNFVLPEATITITHRGKPPVDLLYFQKPALERHFNIPRFPTGNTHGLQRLYAKRIPALPTRLPQRSIAKRHMCST